MALVRARLIRGECAQIFVKNNMQWAGKLPAPAEVDLYKAALAIPPMPLLFGHTGYLINLGAPSSDNREKSLKSLVQEIEIATLYGLPFLVLHPGAHLGAGEAEGLKRIIHGLDEVVAATAKSHVRIALENTAGQGTCLGDKIAHLAAIFDGVKKPARLGICLDTAHFFAAGYDLRTPTGWKAAIGEVDKLIGLDQILAFHLNDSKTDLGSRVDRHTHIGQGKIGREAFRHIVRDPRFKTHPGCLETPKSADLHEDLENLSLLRELAGK